MKLSQLKQQIEELDAKATKGPWVKENHFMYPDGPLLKTTKGMHICYGVGIASEDEIDFIALSRTALPELLRRLLVAEEALDRIKRPVWWMQEDQRRKTGSIDGVSGAAAIALASDANYLRNIATSALATIRGEEK